MSNKFEWVQIVEPRSREHMYANLVTGECLWSPPPSVPIKQSDESEWWELYDANTDRYYYYSSKHQKTVWHKPTGCDIIPIAKLQTIKRPLVGRHGENNDSKEISTQTSTHTGKHAIARTSTPTSSIEQKDYGEADGLRVGESGLNGGGGREDWFERLPRKPRRQQKCVSALNLESTLERDSGSDTEKPLAESHHHLSLEALKDLRHNHSDDDNDDDGSDETDDDESTDSLEMINPRLLTQRSLSSPAGAITSNYFPPDRPVDFSARQPLGLIKPPLGLIKTNLGLVRPHVGAAMSPHVPNSGDYTTHLSSIHTGGVRCSTGLSYQPSHLPSSMIAGSTLQDPPSMTPYTGRALKEVNPMWSGVGTSRPRAFPRTNPTFLGTYRSRGPKALPSEGFSISNSTAHSCASEALYANSTDLHVDTLRARPPPLPPPINRAKISQGPVNGHHHHNHHYHHQGTQQLRHQDSAPMLGSSVMFNSVYAGRQTENIPPFDFNWSGAHACPNSGAPPRLRPVEERLEMRLEGESDPRRDNSNSLRVRRRKSEPDYVNVFNRGIGRKSAASAKLETIKQTIHQRFKSAFSGGSKASSSSDGDRTSEGDRSMEYNSSFGLDPRCDRVSEDPVWMKTTSQAHYRDSSVDSLLTSQPGFSVSGRGSSGGSGFSVTGRGSSVGSGLRLHGDGNGSALAAAAWISEGLPDFDEQDSDFGGGSAQSIPSSSHIRQFQTLLMPSRTPPVVPSFHPSLRKKKWSERPAASVGGHGYITSDPRKNWDLPNVEGKLAAQLQQQQQQQQQQLRPVSMLTSTHSCTAPADFSVIANKVAGSLLQQMHIEQFVLENLNEHRKGLLGKPISIGHMLCWTKDSIQKPMIRTSGKLGKREAVEVFRLIQSYMGDKRTRDPPLQVALDVVIKGWSMPELRDEIYIQLCRQTTRNPSEESALLGWELLGVCLAFFPPSAKFLSYLEGHINKAVDSFSHLSHSLQYRFTQCCGKRLQWIIHTGAKRGLKTPTADDIEQAKRSLIEPSMFGSTLTEIMNMQKDRYPERRLPWIQTTLSELVLKLKGDQTEGIFRVPGDIDEVNSLKVRCDQWLESPSPAFLHQQQQQQQQLGQDIDNDDPHVPASLLKLWYRELYEPLVPYSYYARCVDSCSDPLAAVAVVADLPEINRLVLTYLIRFLQGFARSECVSVTKMDISNLAMVMAPNCLRCISSDPKVIFENTRLEMAFVRTLIQHLDTADAEGLK